MISFHGTVTRFNYPPKNDDGFCIPVLNDNSREIVVKGYLPCVHYGFILSGAGDVQPREGQNETIIIKNVNIDLPDNLNTISGYCMTLLGYDEKRLFEDAEKTENEYDISEFYEEETIFLDKFERQMDELCDYLGKSIFDQIENNFSYVEGVANRRGWFKDDYYNLRHLRANLLLENEIRSVAAELRDVDPIYAKFTKILFKVFHNTSELNGQYSSVLSCLQENPYAFCFRRYLPGYSFDVADAIAAKYELPTDSYNRCCAGIKHAFISRIMSEGHVFTTEEQLLHESMDVLNLPEDVLIPHMESMYQNQILVKETPLRAYLKEFYDMEVYIAEKLNAINRQKCDPNLISPDFEKIESQIGLTLSEEQKEAIRGAVNSNVTLITGGPGTGKTTIVRGIIAAFEEAGECSIMLAAPTGKAAVRLEQTTERNAQTIHRLLGIKPDSSRNEVSEIVNSAIIIDEASMIDIDLMDKLMYGISLPAHLILVGDANQLPSVNPGYVFHDTIEANCFQTFKLSQVFRQEAHSDIKLLAENIIRGEMIPAPVGESDYRFIPAENKPDIRKKIVETIDAFLNNGYERKDTESSKAV